MSDAVCVTDSADDGKTVLLIVDPKAPALTVRATGDGQFYTTPPKAYFTPKICDQTTFFSVGKGTVNFEIRDLFGKNVFYRVGGKGDFINARSSAVTLAGSLFAPGTNTLQYYYNGNEKYTKTRIVVKNPSFPSAAEKHGHYLFGDTAQTAKVLARAKRPPYSSYYENYKTRRDSSGQEAADTTMAAPGLRQRAQNGYANTLGNVIVAKIAGWKYTIPGSRLSSGQYAKFMMLNNTRIIDPLGFELSHSADAIPSRELHLRGYYDSDPVQETLFTYDLFAENFRSDQVDGGMTAIEDYFVRDRLAGFAFEAMQWSAGINLMDSPGLWGTARMMTGVEIGLVMSEYSTSYYGTSGFGSVQSTYMLCPYQNDQLTWKQALFDANTPKTSYPDYKWGTGISGRGRDDSLIPTGEFIFANNTWPPFTWSIKSAYFSSGQMGKHLTIWANMAKRFAGGYTDPGLEVAMLRASLGTLMSAGDGFPSPNSRFTQLLVCNPLWPQIVSNTIPYALTLPDSDPNSFRSAWPGFYALFWYDDTKSIPQAPKNLRLKVASTAATLPK